MIFSILILIMILAAIVFLICLCSKCEEWSLYSPDNAAKIKFVSFKQFYSINPDRWILKDAYVICKIDHERQGYSGLFNSRTEEKFRFGFFDYLKYDKFCDKLKSQKIENKNMMATSEMLRMVKRDIANMESLGQQQQKQAMDNFNNILNNLGGAK